ncbi:HAD family hydrolase [Roseateles sp.]|uniref:HAD family hydrolase n=1 Tax=Roseateles sp. TaxID=1971397 RepID=UPI00286D0D86|nr:HAD family hydrolase [Roseateles sp.]
MKTSKLAGHDEAGQALFRDDALLRWQRRLHIAPQHGLGVVRRALLARAALIVATAGLSQTLSLAQPSDPLPSWNAGPAKARILAFVKAVTETGGPDFVAPAERIAVFDNDGTLWAEQPMYFQLAFALDRVKAMAPSHPEWKNKPPFKDLLNGDMKAVMAGGEKALLELVAAAHAGATTEEFAAAVQGWLATAKHPRFKRLFTELVYAPMLELLSYLRVNGFQTWIVSGGGIEFMRVFAEQVYGVPPHQVVGSSLALKYELRDGKPVLVQQSKLFFNDDKGGKPVGIHKAIGRRPIMAFGNSDGDFQMLEWTSAGPGPRFAAFVHHDDGEREYAYDRDSKIGRLARGLDETGTRGWTVISMKSDWAQVFSANK